MDVNTTIEKIRRNMAIRAVRIATMVKTKATTPMITITIIVRMVGCSLTAP
jgi:hypothetical protein